MCSNTDWTALKEQRNALVERFRALPFDVAWQELRAALEKSPSIYSDNILTVYEGPIRTFLLPLPYELLRAFIQERGAIAADCLFLHSEDSSPLVSAYCLHGLAELEDKRLPEAAARVANRQDKIHTIFGSFGWTGKLSEYGLKLQQQYSDDVEHAPWSLRSV